MAQEKNKSSSSDSDSSDLLLKILLPLGTLMNKVGVSGFVVLAITAIIFTFPTSEQKHEIVDNWLLFKGKSTAFYVILGCMTFLMLGQRRYYKKTLKLHEVRNTELEGQLNDLRNNKLTHKNVKIGGK